MRSLFIAFLFCIFTTSCRADSVPAFSPTPDPFIPVASNSIFPPLLPTPIALSPEPSPLAPTSSAILSTVSPTPTPVFAICSPLAGELIPELWEIVSDPYNPPPAGSDERHQGVDFSHYSRKGRKTIEGEAVQAALPGWVAAVIEDRPPYGNMVMVETPAAALPAELRQRLEIVEGQSLYLLYAHLGQSPTVHLGDPVQCGEVLGEVGKTGYNIVNPHLHLETRLGPAGVQFDGMAFYTTSATEAEMSNYLRWRTSGEFKHFDPLRLFEFARQPAVPTPASASH